MNLLDLIGSELKNMHLNNFEKVIYIFLIIIDKKTWIILPCFLKETCMCQKEYSKC